MNTETAIRDGIEQAATTVGSVWPLHSFVTANPLSGFEDQPFHDAVQQGQALFGGDGYPSPAVFRQALETGQIDRDHLQSTLADHGYEQEPEALLDEMETTTASGDDPDSSEVDQLLTKWLSAFLDQGQAKWSMPNREAGFYDAFRAVAPHDGEIPDPDAIAEMPDDPIAAIEQVLDDHPVDHWADIFEHQLAALPGWTGFIKQRAEATDDWQSTHPITLVEYLAVRLTLADLLEEPIDPSDGDTVSDTVDDGTSDEVPLPELWLSAWEATYRGELVEAVTDESEALSATTDGGRPDAQLVFCIDTRSEIIRRHIEATGDYETHGYAGFFGVPMRHQGYDTDVAVDACPPILDAQHHIADRPTSGDDDIQDTYDHWSSVHEAATRVLETVKTNASTAFSFVETTGPAYGLALTARTLVPGRVHDLLDAADERVPDDHEFCKPTVEYNPDAVTDLREGLTLDEQVEYAANAFELMGWETFARVVAFVGHASETTNNPFDSSLDCGACAGNPGGPNARVLATICNDDAVQAQLRERGFEIPDDTLFVAGEHNTTTDEITLFTDVPESHEADVEQLRANLDTARVGAATERTQSMNGQDAGVRNTERRAADWAETRPEWGLAGNAGFVIGSRELTDDLDLDGRSFLHSYDWSTDESGDALEAIMTGPMVVTQWINTQYYFATVDNAVYGSGSKITHNPVGNVGVYQGNGGDLMTGLPLQSLMAADDDPYHQPLRLSTVIHAPVERVTDILRSHDDLATLLDNGWLSLTVVDPEQEHAAFHYDGDCSWVRHETTDPEPTTAEPMAATADD
ncbi:MAG: DUF2309 domain-containing protein [Halorientalis sp.]